MKKPIQAPGIDHRFDEQGWVERLELPQEDAVRRLTPTFNWLFGHCKNLLDTKVFDTVVTDPYRNGEDFRASWEEAFLFRGFDNGKAAFLTSSVMYQIDRHGFVSTATFHWPEKRNPALGNNEIIVRLQYKDQECIPENDKFGRKVIQGLTNPRDYLPSIVIKLLDEDFGQK
jgi:hypothetical protein